MVNMSAYSAAMYTKAVGRGATLTHTHTQSKCRCLGGRREIEEEREDGGVGRE